MTQMKGGLNSHCGCAGLPLPRDFGHFASPSWLTMKKKSTMYKMKMANEGKKQEKRSVLESALCMNE